MLELTINGKDTTQMSLKKGEKVNLILIFTDDGQVMDVSSAAFTVMIKTAKGETADITIADGDMDKTDASTGTVLAPLDTSTLTVGDYLTDIKAVFSGTSQEFSPDINLKVIGVVTE